VTGPFTGRGYDIFALVLRVRVVRGGVTCIDESGTMLGMRPFVRERYHETLVIDEALCPRP